MKSIFKLFIFFIAILIILPLLFIKQNNTNIHSKNRKDIFIDVYIHDKSIVEKIELEDYIKGVVAAEMPASFELEALKAQAVAARTYAYGRIKGVYEAKHEIDNNIHICTDSTHCQAWLNNTGAMKKWGVIGYTTNWFKISRAVDETAGEIIMYDKKITNPVFHSNSGGKTENTEDVWIGKSVPYLRSVESKGEEDKSSYQSVVIIKNQDFIKIIKKDFPDAKFNTKDIVSNIKVLEFSEGKRVKKLTVAGIEMNGTDFRKIFSLNSTNFKLENEGNDNIKITVIGNGHGVGMSQCGADYMAKEGYTYEDILKHYYTGVYLEKIEEN